MRSILGLYRWLWRESFVGETPCDRFIARGLLLSIHFLVLALVIELLAMRELLR